MKFKVLTFFFVLFCFALAIFAQEHAQIPPASGQLNPVDNQGGGKYLLGPGDVLDVKVFGQQDLMAIVDIDSDGNISSLPFIETPIRAKCRTVKEVQKDIAAAYRKLLKEPQVSVRIAERKSRQPVAVWGAVRQPTRIPVIRKVRLNEIMAASGGITERASGTIQILHTEPLMCPQSGEEIEAAPIDGTSVPLQVVKIADMKLGKAEANPLIRPGDYIIVTEAEPIYITGSVVAPQGVYSRDQLTLSIALAMVGGVKKEARASDVRIYRLKPGAAERETLHVDLADIQKNRRPDVPLQAFDWIEVPEAGMLDRGRLVPSLRDLFLKGVLSLPLHL
jgi:polysaccharide export outer membrane protein